MTLQKFNDKDLLRTIRTGILNPMVDATNSNTLDVNTLRGSVAGAIKRVSFLEPEVGNNTKNLFELNRFARAVAQQVSTAYDKSDVDAVNKHLTFTSIGGVEKTLDLSRLFPDAGEAQVIVGNDTNPETLYSVHNLNFKDNVTVSINPDDNNKADISVPKPLGQVEEKEVTSYTNVKLTGNVGESKVENNILTIDLPDLPQGGDGLTLSPNPPENGKNLFKDQTQALAEAKRDAYFATTVGQADLESYKKNVLKAILVEWSDLGAEASEIHLQFQCYHTDKWINPFDITFTSFVITNHSIGELKDGDRVGVLERDTIDDGVSVGNEGEEVYAGKASRKIKLKRIKTTNNELLSLSTKDECIRIKPRSYWGGYFNTEAEANSAIPVSGRFAGKTTIITRNAHDSDTLHVWSGSAWEERSVTSEISIDGKNWVPLKGIAPGRNIKISSIPGTKSHMIEALSPVSAYLTGQPPARLEQIEVTNKFAKFDDGKLTLPGIGVKCDKLTDMGQISSIKAGTNVAITCETDGTTTISSTATPTPFVKVKTGTDEEVDLIKIEDSSPYATSADGTYKPHNILFEESTDSLKPVKNIKAGSNVTITESEGVLTFDSTTPTPIQVQAGKKPEKVLTKIFDPTDFSDITEEGALTLHAIDLVGADGQTQGFVKSLKASDNMTMEMTSGGVLTFKVEGGGSGPGGSIQAKVEGGEYKNITKIEATKSPAVIEDGILKLKPLIYKKANDEVVTISGGVKSIKAGVGIGLSEDDESDNTILINNEGMLKGKLKNETETTSLRQISQITFVSDKTHGSFDESDKGVLTLDTRGFPAGASTLEELKQKFPPEDNAYRHGYIGSNKHIYFAHVNGSGSSSGAEWVLHNYYGMAAEVESLNNRFPEMAKITPGTYDPDNPVNGVYYVTKPQCPLVTAEYKEYGIVHNIIADKTKRSQYFYGLQSGNTWYRIMNPTSTEGKDNEFMEWNLLNGLSEDHYSVMTTPSLNLEGGNKGYIGGTKYLPWMVMQDPKCNVSVDGATPAKFRVNKSGTYDITVCIHITADADKAAEAWTSGASYTVSLVNGDTSSILSTKTVTNVKPAAKNSYNEGMYPPVRVTFTNVKADQRNSYSVKVTMSRASIITNGYLDSFKNYLVVQPTSSGSKQGTVIADNWRTAFGGFSCKDGYEVHVEGNTNSPKNVRVYGAVINNKLHNV